MRAMTYLYFTRVKNRLKGLVRRPGKLVLYLGVIALFLFVLLSPGTVGGARPARELYTIILGFFSFVFVMSLMTGLGTGASFYTMADVNFLFTAPVSSKRVLVYGLVRQLGTALTVGLVLFFQYGWLRSSYGVDFPMMLMIALGYAAMMFCAQLTAMWIYCISSASDSRKRIIKAAIYGVCALALLLLAVPPLLEGLDNIAGRLVDRAAAPAFLAFPVSGWITAVLRGFHAGEVWLIGAGLGALAAFLAIFTLAITRLNADYYEDVLSATEASHSAVTAAKEGTVQEATRRNIKVGRTGIRRGRGPGVFFHKHRLESRRGSVVLFSGGTLVMLVTCGAFAVFMRDEGFFPAHLISCLFLLFTVNSGRWVREFTKPYVYMIPEKPFRKLVMVCGESIFQCALETVAVVLLIGLITAASPVEMATGALARLGLGLILIAVTVVLERVFGGITAPSVVMVLYLLALMLFAGPGLVLALVAALVMDLSLGAAMGIFALWSFGLSALLIFLCRNMLTWAEMNNR